MELQTLKCPDCSGQVHIDHAMYRAKCEYCGHIFLLEDKPGKAGVDLSNPRQFGREFEYGRMEAQSFSSPEVLAEEIRSLKQPLNDLAALETKLSDSSIKLDKLSNKLFEGTTLVGKLRIFIFPIFILILAYILSSTQSSQTNFLILGGVLAVLSLFPILLIRRVRLSLLKRKIRANKSRRLDIQEEIRGLHERYDFDLVPDEYRKADDMAFLISSLKTRRARTIEQAISLNEDLKHKRKMEDYQQTQIKLQKELLKEARKSKETAVDNKDISIGKELLKGAAIIAGTAIISSLFNRKK